MSGGSYDYLYVTDDFSQRRWAVESMARRLEELGVTDAAELTQSLIPEVPRDHPIRKLWHAVEWRDSCDWGDDQLQEAINKWKEANGDYWYDESE